MGATLPPNQRRIDSILRWNVDHSGIISKNPRIDLTTWRLVVDGEVESPKTFSWSMFLQLPAIASRSDFHCVEGWSVSKLEWYGVRFGVVTDLVKPSRDGINVLFSCADGYTTSLALRELIEHDALLAYKLNDELLESALGGPLRLIIPNKYAYKNAMWINRITFLKEKTLGYWEQRGYSDNADVWKNERYARR